MSISSFLARSSLAAVAVVISGCRLSDVQDPATLPTLAAGRASYAAQSNGDKTDICHRANGDSEFILISVASPAVDAHLAHGDGRPGEAFPGKPGMRFGANCQPEIIAFDLTLDWSARGMIRDANRDGVGDEVVLNNPLLEVVNGFAEEHRGVLEYGISQFTRAVGHADLTLVVQSGFSPSNVYVFMYAGDGAATLSDYAAGSLVTSFLYVGQTQVTLDVTAALNSLIASHASYAGFNLRIQGPDLSGARSIVFATFHNPLAGSNALLRVRTP